VDWAKLAYAVNIHRFLSEVMIYIVIPVFNRWNYTSDCLQSLLRQTNKAFVTVVVDHGSTDDTSERISREFPEVVVIKGDSSMWWTAATNLGVRYALEKRASYILTLNNDLVVPPEYIDCLYKAAVTHTRAIIGSISLNIVRPEKVMFAGVRWNPWNSKYKGVKEAVLPYTALKSGQDSIDTDLLPGRGTLVPSHVFEAIGLFDERRFPHYMADEDFSLRAVGAGYRLITVTDCAVLSHVEATGLNNGKRKKGIPYLMEAFTSIKSPSKLSTRWHWATRHGKIPVLYFVMDFGRVIISQVIKSVRA
jgi:GT2 family glycosyltransferase